MTDEEIQQLFNMIDKDKSGKLSLRVIILLLFLRSKFVWCEKVYITEVVGTGGIDVYNTPLTSASGLLSLIKSGYKFACCVCLVNFIEETPIQDIPIRIDRPAMESNSRAVCQWNEVKDFPNLSDLKFLSFCQKMQLQGKKYRCLIEIRLIGKYQTDFC